MSEALEFALHIVDFVDPKQDDCIEQTDLRQFGIDQKYTLERASGIAKVAIRGLVLSILKVQLDVIGVYKNLRIGYLCIGPKYE